MGWWIFLLVIAVIWLSLKLIDERYRDHWARISYEGRLREAADRAEGKDRLIARLQGGQQ